MATRPMTSHFATHTPENEPSDMILLCRVSDIPLEDGLRVTPAGMEPVAIFRLGEEIVAVDDTCTHGSASLSDGMLEGEDIICPFHAGAFNLRTGEPTASPCTMPLKTHRVVIRDGSVFLVP